MSGGIRFNRTQLEAVFGNNFEAIRQFELLMEQVDELSNAGLDADRINLDVTNFNGVLSATDENVQLAMDTIDNITTTKVPEGTNLYWTNARFDSRLATKTTSDLTEGSNLYYTEARVNANRKNNILEYGYQSVTASTTVTKTITVFTGSTASQTITLPTAGTTGRKVEVINNGTVKILISGSSVLGELYPNESAEFVDLGADWVA